MWSINQLLVLRLHQGSFVVDSAWWTNLNPCQIDQSYTFRIICNLCSSGFGWIRNREQLSVTFSKISHKNRAHTVIPVTSFPCTYGGRAVCPQHSGAQATSPCHPNTKRPLSLPLYEPMITGPLACETAIRQLASARNAAPAVTNFANTHGDRSLEPSTHVCTSKHAHTHTHTHTHINHCHCIFTHSRWPAYWPGSTHLSAYTHLRLVFCMSDE